MANLQSTDLIVVGRGGTSYQTTFEDFKDSVFIDSPLGINEVLTEGNVADPLQSLRFRFGVGSAPNPDSLNPDPILLEDGIGSAHRALASSYTTHVGGTGGLHSDINSSYLVNYILDGDAVPAGMAKLSASYGFSFFHGPELTGTGNSQGIDIGPQGLDVNGKFKVDFEGSVEATEFIGDGSKLTNLPTPDVDAYTKVESDAKYIVQNINSLPELPTT